MFTYCNNNPLDYSDPSGFAAGWSNLVYDKGGYCGGGFAVAAVATVGLIPILHESIEAGARALSITYSKAKDEVYEFSKSLRVSLKITSNKLPHVHHIVPVGNFSNRSADVVSMIAEMHDALRNAGINRYFDPMNLMLVSAGTHSTLHTDAYIAHVHSYIMGSNGSREAIYGALFYLRLEIAAWDILASGFY